MSYGRRVAEVCEQCAEIFTRRVVDAGRCARVFCSKACHASSMRTGRRMVEVSCSGCGVLFKKLPSEVARSSRHYCTPACYHAHVDRSALGRLGAAAGPRHVPLAARFYRAQQAGLARARNLSPARLREIAMMGVAARLAKKATRGPYRRVDRREITAGLEWVGPLLMREQSDG